MSARAACLAAAAAAALAGCVGETVERRKPRRGPVAEVGFVDYGGGRVRYSLEGWSWFVAGRRRDALRRARRNCGRQLEAVVVDEYRREDAEIAYAGDDVGSNLERGVDHFKVEPFQHLVYECRPKGEARRPEAELAPAVSTAAAPSPFLVVPPAALLPGATVAAPVPALEPAPAPTSEPGGEALPSVSTAAPAAPEAP